MLVTLLAPFAPPGSMGVVRIEEGGEATEEWQGCQQGQEATPGVTNRERPAQGIEVSGVHAAGLLWHGLGPHVARQAQRDPPSVSGACMPGHISKVIFAAPDYQECHPGCTDGRCRELRRRRVVRR